MKNCEKRTLFLEEGKIVCARCKKELNINDIFYSKGLCLDCAYHLREIDLEDVADILPIIPTEVVTNDDGTMTVLIFKRPTLEECGG